MRRQKRSRGMTPILVDDDTEVEELKKRVLAEAPAPGTQPFTEGSQERKLFTALPLSQRTTRGLTDGDFETMTEIQVSLSCPEFLWVDFVGRYNPLS